MKRALLTVLVVLAAAAGCDDSVRFKLRLEWQRESPDGASQVCPTDDGSYTCRAIPLTCDVRVRVRIVGASDDQSHYSECFRIENDGTACLLADLPISPRAVPNEMVRVQVIVWTVEELIDSGVDLSQTDGCPVTTPFVPGGLSQLGGSPILPDPPREPVPALAGEAYFRVGQSPIATVTLGCPGWDALNALSCRDNSVTVETVLRNPSTFSSVLRADAVDDSMEVRPGVPSPDGEGGFHIESASLSPALTPTGSGALLWRGLLSAVPPDTMCLRADSQAVGQGTLTCFAAPQPDADRTIRPDGFLVGQNLQTSIRTLFDLPELPQTGTVLGIVLDSNGHPVEGATVIASGGATVVYPDANIQTVLTSTGPKGFFLSLDAGYETVWDATGPNNLDDDGSARGGRVDNHVSVVVVRLNGPVAQAVDAGVVGPVIDGGVDAP